MSSHATLQTRLTSVITTIERIFFGKLSGKTDLSKCVTREEVSVSLS